MYQKLETRLMLYEKDHPIKDDHELVAAIESILDEQDSLPVEERDFDLIAEATNTILKLQGYDENHLDEMASEAAASVRTRIADNRTGTSNGQLQSKHHHVLRWIIPLVAILAITTVAVFASPTNRLAITDMTKQLFSSLTPKAVYHEGNMDLEITNKIETFSTFEELSTSFDNSILLPFDIEEKLKNLHIEVSDLGDSVHINISFDENGNPCSIKTTVSHTPIDSSILYNTKIGGREVSINIVNNQIYAEWTENQIYYHISSSNRDSVELIINSMRLKNE